MCISRITNKLPYHFGDGKHNFYAEFRCGNKCTSDTLLCNKCSQKNPSSTRQESHTFIHGNVNEPISKGSHIYDGPWYHANVRKWGQPLPDVIEIVTRLQQTARQLIDNITEMKEPLPIEKPSPIEKLSPIEKPSPIEEPSNATKKTKKTANKSPYETNIIEETTREVSIPTHIETYIEEFNVDDYETEYITLSLFSHNGNTYFRDTIKNKLYKRIKDSAGQYIGRYDTYSDTIINDVPDSDDEE